MEETTANEFRKKLKYYTDKSILDHTVLKVKRRSGDHFVVLGEKDWKAIEETIYLNQFPGLAESIADAAVEPLDQGTALEDLDW